MRGCRAGVQVAKPAAPRHKALDTGGPTGTPWRRRWDSPAWRWPQAAPSRGRDGLRIMPSVQHTEGARGETDQWEVLRDSDALRNEKSHLSVAFPMLPGGEGGIRTHGTVTRTPDFESGTFDHSATSPGSVDSHRCERPHYTHPVAKLASHRCKSHPGRARRGQAHGPAPAATCFRGGRSSPARCLDAGARAGQNQRHSPRHERTPPCKAPAPPTPSPSATAP